MDRRRKKIIIKISVSAALLAGAGILMLLFHHFPESFFPGYRRFSAWLMDGISRVVSFSKIALWDFLEVLLILLFIGSIIRMIVKRRLFLSWLSNVLMTVSVLAFLVVSMWMLNHYGPPLSESLGLEIRAYTEEELCEAFIWYLDEASGEAALVPRDEEGALLRQDFYELAGIAGASYEALGERYEIFRGSRQPVKKLWLTGEWLLTKGFTGEFMPFTAEASVPENGDVSDLPFTMCHEAAHRLGIAGENEANFSAYLACAASEDVRFRYAGNFMAFIYLNNALNRENPGRLRKLLAARQDDPGTALVLLDASIQRVHYEKYDGPIADAGDRVNDAYLKSFSEESGTKSYGEVVNELVAWYLENAESSGS